MKFSEQWLREWVDPPVSTHELADQLTMLGMEVEETAPASPGDLDGVVAGRVEAVEKHPRADKLIVCTVRKDEGSSVTVVTGAPGVEVGRCYPYAGVGLALTDPRTYRQKEIEEKKIRGVTSTGMLCSAAELNLSDEADELFLLDDDALPGEALSRLMQLDDRILDVGLTPNRGDCLSINGIAREVAVVNRLRFEPPPATPPVPAAHEDARAVSLAAPDGCPRYVGRVINNIDISRPSPLWLREKLRRCGLRCLNVVVDITNYVMLELGQPMHAFDNDKLNGAICVRYAVAGEGITLLDGESRALPESTLVIADAEQAVAMAGVMGGMGSAISGTTRHVFLESAFFTPLVVAGRARSFGLHTDASHRFERGVDFMLQRRAMERATRLILDICGGEPGPVTEAVAAEALPKQQTVGLRPAAVAGLLGETIDMQECLRILTCLGLEETASNTSSRDFRVPSHRFDITLEADLVEEIARVYGYRKIRSAQPPARLNMRRTGFRERLEQMRRVLVQRGYQEAITYSFVSHTLQSRLFPEIDSIALLNAISSDMERMRLSVWPGLLTALRYNLNRQQERVRLFETGKVFSRNGKIQQLQVIGGLSYGTVAPEQWDAPYESGNFYDIKSDVEAVLTACCGPVSLEYRPVAVAALHQGKAAEILCQGQQIGLVGELHPAIQSGLEIERGVYLFELFLERLPGRGQPNYEEISRFPVVKRDLSVVIDEKIPIADLLQCIDSIELKLDAPELSEQEIQAAETYITGKESEASEAPNYLTDLELIDVYQGEPVAAGKKSVTLGLTFQRFSDTLMNRQVDSMVSQILNSLREELDAQLRE